MFRRLFEYIDLPCRTPIRLALVTLASSVAGSGSTTSPSPTRTPNGPALARVSVEIAARKLARLSARPVRAITTRSDLVLRSPWTRAASRSTAPTRVARSRRTVREGVPAAVPGPAHPRPCDRPV